MNHSDLFGLCVLIKRAVGEVENQLTLGSLLKDMAENFIDHLIRRLLKSAISR